MAAEHWNYTRYDGSMSAGARNDAVTSFMEKKDCKAMLISLKAGNAGLNLTVASQGMYLKWSCLYLPPRSLENPQY